VRNAKQVGSYHLVHIVCMLEGIHQGMIFRSRYFAPGNQGDACEPCKAQDLCECKTNDRNPKSCVETGYRMYDSRYFGVWTLASSAKLAASKCVRQRSQHKCLV